MGENNTEEKKPVVMNTVYNAETGVTNIIGEASPEEDKAKLDQMWESFSSGEGSAEEKMKALLQEDGEFDAISQLEDISKLTAIVQDINAGKKINSAYEKLPSSMKGEVYKLAAKAAVQNGAPVTRQILNFTAKAVLEELAKEFNAKNMGVDIDEMFAKLYTDIRETTDNLGKETADMFMSTLEDRKASLDAAIQKATEANDMKAVEKFKLIEKASEESFTLNDFKEACKSIRVKKFHMEKPNKIYDDFNYKFRNTEYPINNIADCPRILDVHGIEFNDALKLCLAFCIYCNNMKPENYDEYIFMYYFIRNIIILDRVNHGNDHYDQMDEKSKNYYDTYLGNLKEALSNLK